MSDELKKYLDYNYPIELIHLNDEDGGGYVAEIPFLGRDAFTGYGKTVDEALASLNEIKEYLFEDYLKNGVKIPSPPTEEDYSGKFVLRVPKNLHRVLSEKAKADSVSLNTLCISLLSQNYSVNDIKKYVNSICFELKGLKSKIGQYSYSEKLKTAFQGNVAYFPDKDLRNVS